MLIDDDLVVPCPAALERMLFSRAAATRGAGAGEVGGRAGSGGRELVAESGEWGDDADVSDVSDEDEALQTEAGGGGWVGEGWAWDHGRDVIQGAARPEGDREGARAYMCLYTRVC